MCPLATQGAGMVIMVAGFGGKSGMSIQAGHGPVGTRMNSGMPGSADTCTCPHKSSPTGKTQSQKVQSGPVALPTHV